MKRLAGHYSIKQSCGHIEQIFCENTLTFKQFPPSRPWMIKSVKQIPFFPSLKSSTKRVCFHVFPFVEEAAIEAICLVKMNHFICSKVIFIEIITKVLRCNSIGNYIFLVCPFIFQLGLMIACFLVGVVAVIGCNYMYQKFLTYLR